MALANPSALLDALPLAAISLRRRKAGEARISRYGQDPEGYAHDILGVAAILGVQAIEYKQLYPGAGEKLPGETEFRKKVEG